MERTSSAPGTEADTQFPYKRQCTLDRRAQTGYTMPVGPVPRES